MTTPEIKAWLASTGHDRQWLADQIGSTKGTVNQWFYRGFPEWAVLSIGRLAKPPMAQGELSFTDSEFDLILEAMRIAGYTKRQEFYRDAITARAEEVASTRPVLPFPQPAESLARVAEEPVAYLIETTAEEALLAQEVRAGEAAVKAARAAKKTPRPPRGDGAGPPAKPAKSAARQRPSTRARLLAYGRLHLPLPSLLD